MDIGKLYRGIRNPSLVKQVVYSKLFSDDFVYRGIRNPSFLKQVVYSKLFSDDFIYNRISRNRKHAWQVAAPKSGSTWLSTMLSNALDWQVSKLVPSYGTREQVVDARQLMFYSTKSNLFSVHQHCKFSEAAFDIINRANIKVILQLRNIFDTVVSIKDHMENESVSGFISWMDMKNWEQLSDKDKLDFIIDMMVPWYFSFFIGWLESELAKNNRIHIVTYENLVKDPLMELHGILKFLDEERNQFHLQKVIENTKINNTIRLNKGIIGRGLSTLTSEQMHRIIRYSKYYTTVDFNLIGIHTPV